MSLFDWIKPKWKHRDAAIREQAVLALKRQDVLETIVDSDSSEQVRLAAISRITDESILVSFACRNDSIAIAAMKRLTDRKLIAYVGLRSNSRDVRELAVDSLDDGVVLHRIANSDTNARVRLKARKKHTGRDATRDVIQNELSRLQPTATKLEKTPELHGTLDEVSRALVTDSRFQITGSLEANVPGQASIRELDQGVTGIRPEDSSSRSTAPAARFLALKRTEGPEPEDESVTRAFYEIAVWRTDENTFHGYTEEKHLNMVINPVMWSSVSNGATPSSAFSKVASGIRAISKE